ncbi:hypothetical protein [Rhodococcus globerulus]|uniref:hypothetical protein n=1 Tax=Rhodococcus globerulus TaxID=33008 RepID=UPI003018C93F
MTTILASDFLDGLAAWSTFGGALGTFLVVVVTAAVAVGTLRASKRDSRDKTRPMVGALLDREAHPSSHYAQLHVRNYGPTVAYNVKVTFDPEIKDVGTKSGENSFVPFLLGRYGSPIPTMMPGVELTNIWSAPGPRDENGKPTNDEPIPDVVTATIRYSDRPDFWAKNTNRYEDTFTLDMSIIKMSISTTHTDDHLGLHKRSVKALESIAPNMRQIATDIHQIEDDVKPDHIRERQAAEYEESARSVRQMSRQLLGDRSPYADDDETIDATPDPISEN